MWQHGLGVLIEENETGWIFPHLITLALFHVWVGALHLCCAQVFWLRAHIFLYSCLTQCGSVYLVVGVQLINKLCPRQPLHTMHSAVIFFSKHQLMQSFCAGYFQPELFPSIIYEHRSPEYTSRLHSTLASEVDLAQRHLASFCPTLHCGSKAGELKELRYSESKGRGLKTCRHITMTGNHIDEKSFCEEACYLSGHQTAKSQSQAQWGKKC